MNCIDYRRLITSDPAHSGAEVLRHRLACQPCAALTSSMQQFDRRLRDAMMVEVPRDLESRVILAATGQRNTQRRWMSIAAGAVVGIAISFGVMWNREAPESLHDSVVGHIYHEANLLVSSSELVPRPKLIEVLDQVGVRLVGEVGDVTYVGLCYFRGHLVPHIMVRGEEGPVTVMLLPNEKLETPVTIHEDGFSGTIVPVKGGSIAVVGTDKESTPALEQRLVNAVEWQI